ncbi:uncharacterized protein LOC123509901 [Portunus trituberculatus]|uniref:uncharacterized protein LOC123509901 n=1 Tax=Portunus trituberculatus TaxID=210409 RepID=UPI001E1D2134|nr:uncharacterized protein LOC123509901 [Portunus trituberculatus]XP_045120457.1 uncharacterized protein LOC123509901 [Portunus trituberculatus]XP_045120462.1 uncharacterized protein LOC123509901 [Portunus trituberculatus]XP_045120469.1 uncharacterized protein LOC123509901 [Portunus trituberculatus]XP_045120475.1 uncharacterized protein LOC123509901 [Portunus trituberculatus]XP_045120481.1 uncharacterized protein LOC123509901 [Portunus trituberculatus]XP_045120487.1 uncharacterized protein LO
MEKKSTDAIYNLLMTSFKKIVTVKVGHVTKSASITGPARLPGRELENLTCTDWSCEVAVDHDCKKDNGPNIHVKFVLEAWNETRQSFSPVKTVDRNITKNFTAKVLWRDFDLRPFTNYSLTAYPANSKGKRKNKSISEKFTTPEAPPNVTNLVGRLLEEKNQIQLSWKPNDDYFSRQGVRYYVLLCNDNCEDMPYTTNTTMTISYEGRPVATKYTAEIKACIPK